MSEWRAETGEIVRVAVMQIGIHHVQDDHQEREPFPLGLEQGQVVDPGGAQP